MSRSKIIPSALVYSNGALTAIRIAFDVIATTEFWPITSDGFDQVIDSSVYGKVTKPYIAIGLESVLLFRLIKKILLSFSAKIATWV